MGYERVLKEKRDVLRIIININAAIILNNKPIEILIKDLSEKGVRIDSPVKLSQGAVFPLSVKLSRRVMSEASFERNTIQVKVLWCRKVRFSTSCTVGLIFEDSPQNIEKSWVPYILKRFGKEKDEEFTKRDTLRVFTRLPVRCRFSRDAFINGIVENISLSGLLMTLEYDIPMGTLLLLSIGPYKSFREVQLKGTIVRKEEGRKSEWLIAVEFIKPTSREIKNIGRLIVALMKEELF